MFRKESFLELFLPESITLLPGFRVFVLGEKHVILVYRYTATRKMF